jgi:hypothetical protein
MWEKQLLIETSSKTDGSFSYMLATQWCLILFPEVSDSPLTFPRNSLCFEPFRWWRCSVQFWAKVDMLATHPPATESRDVCDIFGGYLLASGRLTSINSWTLNIPHV